MRRFIDVVFIHPKNRFFVVLHEGKFWQLARMRLSASSWVFKLLYKGSLDDIYVSKNQAVVDESLSKVLKTYDLPAELHGLNAQRFLNWWDMNDYKWLSTKDVITLDNLPVVQPKPVEPPKTVITPAALAILQKKRLVDSESSSEQTKPTPQADTIPTTTSTPATQADAAFDGIFDQQPTPVSPAPIPSTAADSPSPAIAPAATASTETKTSSLDDFDSIFDEIADIASNKISDEPPTPQAPPQAIEPKVATTTDHRPSKNTPSPATASTTIDPTAIDIDFINPIDIDFDDETNKPPTKNDTAHDDLLDDIAKIAEITATAQPPQKTAGEGLASKTLLDRFNIPQADFTPNNLITSPIPNPPPKKAEPEETAPLMQPTAAKTAQRRPMSKLAEFNAKYAKKPTTPATSFDGDDFAIRTSTPTAQATNPAMSVPPSANLSNPSERTRPTPQAVPRPTHTSTNTPFGASTPSTRPQTHTTPAGAERLARVQAAAALTAPQPSIAQASKPEPAFAAPAPEPKKRESMLDESFDIFDNLLKELTDELVP